jgi:putative FmdB family regulatory protein
VVHALAVPIYEYQCQKCRKTFEYMQSMSDPPKKKCEKCGGKLERLLSVAGFVLKGGGWYKDLYASAKNDGGGGEGAGDGGSGAAEGKSDKPGSKSDKAESKPDRSDKAESKSDRSDKPEKKVKKKSSKGR